MGIRILPLTFNNEELIEAVSEIVRRCFETSVTRQPEPFDLRGGHDPERNQINSNWVLEQLLIRYPANGTKLLALTELDFYRPVLKYVFGEAALGGSAAVVSSHRFHNEFYGLKPDHNLVKVRLLREVVHELGHTYGLVHCRVQECVMCACSYVEEIDLKSSHFCDGCQQYLTEIRGAVDH